MDLKRKTGSPTQIIHPSSVFAACSSQTIHSAALSRAFFSTSGNNRDQSPSTFIHFGSFVDLGLLFRPFQWNWFGPFSAESNVNAFHLPVLLVFYLFIYFFKYPSYPRPLQAKEICFVKINVKTYVFTGLPELVHTLPNWDHYGDQARFFSVLRFTIWRWLRLKSQRINWRGIQVDWFPARRQSGVCAAFNPLSLC